MAASLPPKRRVSVKVDFAGLGRSQQAFRNECAAFNVFVSELCLNRLALNHTRHISVDLINEGAGLGLALVDEHVRIHGGRVWVEDRLDGEPGARFIIELPAEEVGV